MRNRTHLSHIVVSIALTLAIVGCKKEEPNLGKLYSRNLTLQHVKGTELETVLRSIATATNTSQKDVRKDIDGNDMFLYSSNDVLIFVRRKFDEPCGELGCSWKVDVSPADTALSEASQKEVVDTAFTSMARVGDIQSHLSS